MKRGNMKINFRDDTITVLGENIPLMMTSGHGIPITKLRQLIKNWETSSTSSIRLHLSETKGNYVILQWQFARNTTQEKLWDWSINTGQTCWFNNKLKDKIKEVSNVCTTSSHWVTNGEKISEDSSHGLVVIQGTHVSQHHHSFLTKNQKHIQDSDICIWICGQTFVRLQWWI